MNKTKQNTTKQNKPVYVCAHRRLVVFTSDRGEWWCLPLSFCVIIFVYDEVRKLIIRKAPGGMY